MQWNSLSGRGQQHRIRLKEQEEVEEEGQKMEKRVRRIIEFELT